MQSTQCCVKRKRTSWPGFLDVNTEHPVGVVDGLTLVCASNENECSLCLSPEDSVSKLTDLLDQNMDDLPPEYLLVCKGQILSRRPEATLASFGLAMGGIYKLLVIPPVTPTWLRLTAHILCSSFPPMSIPMRASSPVAHVKRELRDLLRIPTLCLSIHLAVGEPLPDGASLRDLGVQDGERIYCRIHTVDPPPAAAVDAERVREQIRRMEGTAEGGV
jgi:hypothetical protein